MLHLSRRIITILLTFLLVTLVGCQADTTEGQQALGASGGGEPRLTLPFPSGEYWQLTQSYGGSSHQDWGHDYYDDRYALDFAQVGCKPYGKDVTPMAAGQVRTVTTGYGGGYGKSVVVDHGGGYASRYAHLSKVNVSSGQWVEADDVIGEVGNTGNVRGTACGDHPGTHLHVAYYYLGAAEEPEPLSGIYSLQTGCWYAREGQESCSGDPGSYGSPGGGTSPSSHGGDFEVTDVEVNPKYGAATDTNFVWSAIVDSPGDKPDVTLWVHNPEHGVDYDFEMETESEENPWVFTYRKTLSGALDYSYWVEAESSRGRDSSRHYGLDVDRSDNDAPWYYSFYNRPSDGAAGSKRFKWDVIFYSEDKPQLTLQIANPSDGMVYDFPMTVRDYGYAPYWFGTYSKSLRDETIYSYWVVAENNDSTDASTVYSVEAY